MAVVALIIWKIVAGPHPPRPKQRPRRSGAGVWDQAMARSHPVRGWAASSVPVCWDMRPMKNRNTTAANASSTIKPITYSACSQAPSAFRVALSLGEVVRWGVARKRSPYPFGIGFIQADSRARFSQCSTFTPLIKSHKAIKISPTPVKLLTTTSKLGKRKNMKKSIR